MSEHPIAHPTSVHPATTPARPGHPRVGLAEPLAAARCGCGSGCGCGCQSGGPCQCGGHCR
jgi:hypothetical protein